ncbi:hypothetical protein BIV25_40895 [Streptomyces sp. MUSC 14]|uniref:hypothetical protein n=1 Tax=Streptomyces sp. MUSC 14 TaxID=1354889 RepID=UPI0008F5EF80|nr:hypothetical protein [Streptomyces sp. MUSC 14]OIJ86527.1 hypothetical protein BIV25_40895 [Streptomyces sp. MUSC 14]
MLPVLPAFAVLVSGGRRSRAVQAAFAGAPALAVLGGVVQTGGVPARTPAARTRASVTPEKVQPCVRRGQVRYCAFAEWQPRVAGWARVTDRVQTLAGGPARGRDLLVRQRVDVRGGLFGDAALLGAAVLAPLLLPGRWALSVPPTDPRRAAGHERGTWLLAGAAALRAASLHERRPHGQGFSVRSPCGTSGPSRTS